ncbi:MAG: carboxypeptidase-like regulatory domain-containing protein [bacterium]|nr:hypothetical protein [Myxococcales bacterium]
MKVLSFASRAAQLSLLSLPLAIAGCYDATEIETTPKLTEAPAYLGGVILDTLDEPVVNATVALAINGIEQGEPVLTDLQGRYALPVSVADINGAQRVRQEIQVLVRPPLEDRGPQGTWAGDRIQMLPITLREFADLDALRPGEMLRMKTGYVPVQNEGFKITPELIREGGTLTWNMKGTPAGDVDVSLVIEPGAIRFDGEDPQDEITMTVLTPEKAPMQIPNDGYGMMWTIQPRNIVFDPPAKIRIAGQRLDLVGLVDVEPGNRFELYGASLDRGWKLFGDIEVVELDDSRVTFESVEGILQRGAWGHVLSNPDSDAGMLATCQNKTTGNYVVCAIFAPRGLREAGPPLSLFETQVSATQQDYAGESDRPFWYTDRENPCRECTNIGRPEAQMAVGLTVGLPEQPGGDVGIFVVATELCQSEVATVDLDARDALVQGRVQNWSLQFGVQEVHPGAAQARTPRTMLWEAYCNDDDACPAYDPADLRVIRRQFSRQHVFVTSNQHCAEDDRQVGR